MPLISESDKAYQKKLDSEDIILDKLADDMAAQNTKLFRKRLFTNRGMVDILLPQIAKIMAASNMIFLENILRGMTADDTSKEINPNEHIYGPSDAEDAKIDIINMTADILKVLIDNKHTDVYPPTAKAKKVPKDKPKSGQAPSL